MMMMMAAATRRNANVMRMRSLQSAPLPGNFGDYMSKTVCALMHTNATIVYSNHDPRRLRRIGRLSETGNNTRYSANEKK
jgi:hypothetical protein